MDVWKIIAAVVSILGLLFTIGKWWNDRRRMRLRVYVRLHKFKVPEFVLEGLKKLKYTDPIRKYLTPLESRGYGELRFLNVSKTSLKNITLAFRQSHFSSYYQVEDDPELRSVEMGKRVVIGDLQPGEERMLYLWPELTVANMHFSLLKNYFHVTADEVHGVDFRYPLPAYWMSRKDDLPKYVSIALVVLFGLIVAVIILVRWLGGTT